MNAIEFRALKGGDRQIVVTTCYDHWSAKLLNAADVDALLVGDSVAMVMHGHDSTIPATVDMMALHTSAVARGAPDKFVITDMPFLSVRRGIGPALDAVEALLRAGAEAVKIEGVAGHDEVIRHIVESGVPVMGHLGMTPQSVHQFGGYRVQGRSDDAAERLVEDAQEAEACGCFALVLECVPSPLAARVTESVQIPTIGIGAGTQVDGQVLVLHDLAGFSPDFQPRFARVFRPGAQQLQEAVAAFANAVRSGDFPTEDEAYR
jgi:3-methyl-2-oxobutanoate hydroxymethyltransferase